MGVDADRMKACDAAVLIALGSSMKFEACCTPRALLTASGGRLATTMGEPVKPAFTVPLNPLAYGDCDP